MGQTELQQFYQATVGDPSKRARLHSLRLGCVARLFVQLLCLGLLGIGAVQLLSIQTSYSQPKTWIVLVVGVLYTLWIRRPYLGTLDIHVGELTDEETRSASSGIYTLQVVTWRERFCLHSNGICEPVPLKTSTYTFVDTAATKGSTVRVVLVNSQYLCPVPERLTLPGSLLAPGGTLPAENAAPARVEFFRRGESEFQQGKLCALSLDIDQFKAYNQQHGSEQADRMLTSVISQCRDVLGPTANFGHCGGDEFSITLPLSRIEAQRLAERLRRRVESKCAVTISLGVAEKTPDCASLAQLLLRADSALKQAKESGKNQVVTF